MTRLILGLLLGLLLGAPATAAAQRLGPPPFDNGLQLMREQRARFDRSMDQLQAQQQLLELQLLRQTLDTERLQAQRQLLELGRQDLEQQPRNYGRFWRRVFRDDE